jgi:zinc D-Ala-D-Ala carboxypeptidase
MTRNLLAAPDAGPIETDTFGIALAALLAKGAAGGARLLQSEKGQAFIAKMKKKASDDGTRFKAMAIRYRNKAAKAKNPKEKAKWQRKALRYTERLELSKARELFATRGIGGDEPQAQGIIQEYRRNVLAAEWKLASPERQKEIKSTIANYDKALAGLKRQSDVLKASGFGQGDVSPERAGKHFTFAEFDAQDAPPAAKESIRALVRDVLDPLREWLDRPVRITSGYRSAAGNAKIKTAAPNSWHMLGKAADFAVQGVPARVLAEAIVELRVPFDQLIWYVPEHGGHVHVSHTTTGKPRKDRGTTMRVPVELDAEGKLQYLSWSPASASASAPPPPPPAPGTPAPPSSGPGVATWVGVGALSVAAIYFLSQSREGR